MPLYEYRCQTCSTRFEALVQGGQLPECPSCQGHSLERLLSVFAVKVSDNHSSQSTAREPGACGTCGDPRGPGSCAMA
jgi:putative FmdB family regulatory protein